MWQLLRAPNSDKSARFMGALVFLFFISIVSARAGNQGQTLNKERIETVLRQYVLERAPWKPENIEIRVIPFSPVTVALGQLSLRIVKANQTLAPGLHSFLIAADIAGKEEARLWVKAEVKVFDHVVVSSFPLAHREVVNAKDVRVERRDISSLYGRPFTRIDDVIGQQSIRPIEVNEVLTQKLLARPTLMKRGSSITLLYETGNLRIETPGTAEEGGRLGDFIQVKNASSGKALRGVVIDGRVVKIN